MQKIQSYLYPNRIEVIANLAGFTVEYTSVYQRTVKIYKGIDNVVELEVKNPDQKRIDLTNVPITVNVMDAAGFGLPSSPYTVTNLLGKGLATFVIPVDDVAALTPQYLKFSLTTVNSDNQTVLLYGDSQYSGIGAMELVGPAVPVTRTPVVYNTFMGEVQPEGLSVKHTSAIPAKFYEAIPTEALSFKISVEDFVGEIWLEATTNDTISVNSFRNAAKLRTFTATDLAPATSIVSFNNIVVGSYAYFRVLYKSTAGIVKSVTVEV